MSTPAPLHPLSAVPTDALRVLIVEDELPQGLALRGLIDDAGGGRVQTTLVGTLETALSRLVDERFDVVLLDLMLPDAHGLEGLNHVLRAAPHLPILVLTGLGHEELIAAAFEDGAQDYLIKGEDDGGKLLRAIRHAVRRKASELRRLERAHCDPLTGLATRTLLIERLERAKRRADREGSCFALMLTDLDDFKRINDTAGHMAGDRVLQEVAHRLTSITRQVDTVARLGGDEFVLLIEGLRSAEDAAMVAHKAVQALGGAVTIERGTFEVGASIGISMYPKDAHDRDRLLELADTAMYEAKRSGRNRFAFAAPEDRASPGAGSSAANPP